MSTIKALLLTALLLCVICFLNAGCNNSGDSGVVGLTQGSGTDVPFTPTPTATKNGYSEIEWAQDTTIRMNPGNVAADYLEPYDGTPHASRPDSGGSDYDVIPLVISEGANFTYSLDSADTTTTIKKAVLIDSSGNTLFTIDKTTPSVTKYLAPGNYDLLVYSGYSVSEANEDHRIVFLYSPQTKDASGKFSQADLKQLLSTKSCPRGDLTGADLSHAKLDQADLRYANLDHAELFAASLFQADLRYANLTDAKLNDADLRQASLNYANLENADLEDANVAMVDLSYANLKDANLTDANLTGANLLETVMPNWSLYNCGTNHPQSWPFDPPPEKWRQN
jgi:uncharacterized protein YjbI with pentapeptide repeats